MRITILTILLLLTVPSIYAQINAITETGDEVILYEEKTWKYLNDSVNVDTEILRNETEFLKGEHLTF